MGILYNKMFLCVGGKFCLELSWLQFVNILPIVFELKKSYSMVQILALIYYIMHILLVLFNFRYVCLFIIISRSLKAWSVWVVNWWIYIPISTIRALIYYPYHSRFLSTKRYITYLNYFSIHWRFFSCPLHCSWP